MPTGVLITREPVVNQQRAITANRVIVHAATVPEAVAALEALRQHWPKTHTVLVSLGRLVPTVDLLGWQPPEGTLIEIPAQALQYTQTQELIGRLNEAGIPLAVSWYQPGAAWPEGVDCRFALADINKVPNPTGAPGVALAWGLADVPAFQQAISQGYSGAANTMWVRLRRWGKSPRPRAATTSAARAWAWSRMCSVEVAGSMARARMSGRRS